MQNPLPRVALGLYAAAVAVAAACTPTQPPPGRPAVLPAPNFTPDSLRQPIVVRSQNRLLEATLEVVQTPLSVPGVGTLNLRAYKLLQGNGISYADSNKVAYPGPTFRIQRGDSVRILLINHLPQDTTENECESYSAYNQGRDTFPNCFHGPNWTNIHYHGMHVTPDSTGDNVLIQIGPDSTWQFAFGIPQNQSPGTHWYHPHKHGSVALQVTNGMAGALIVEGGGLDSLTRANNIKEYLVAVQQVDSQVNLVGTAVASKLLVNGQLNPVIVMRPNEVQRWRLVNENVSKSTTYTLVFEDSTGRAEPKLYDIARDGVQFAPANYSTASPDTNLIVAPGNRLDMFVQAPADTGFHLLNARVVASNVRAQRELPQARGNARGVTQSLLRVRVVNDGTPVQTQLPPSLPPLPSFLNNLQPTADTAAYVVFTDSGAQGGNGPAFYLGRRDSVYMKFNPDSVFLPLPLDRTQTWKVSNNSANGLNHPFHIHVNPFQVVYVYAPLSTDGNQPLYQQINAAAAGGFPIWMDVFPLPLSNGDDAGYIVLRQAYEDFTGKFVMHCHILGHEERGMMQLLDVVGPGGSTSTAGGGHRH
ncbi:MAG TPA: multicopper oxidase family protein [Longimicrobiaceae bacterium]|nr:multicopper oxidase family protein [Longimicrobiaceae bacterium]